MGEFEFLEIIIDKKFAIDFHNELNKHHNYLKKSFKELHKFQKNTSFYWTVLARIIYEYKYHKDFLEWKTKNNMKAVSINEFVCIRILYLLGDEME